MSEIEEACVENMKPMDRAIRDLKEHCHVLRERLDKLEKRLNPVLLPQCEQLPVEQSKAECPIIELLNEIELSIRESSMLVSNFEERLAL